METVALILACLATTGYGQFAAESGDVFDSLTLKAMDSLLALQRKSKRDSADVDQLQSLTMSLLALNPNRGLHRSREFRASSIDLPMAKSATMTQVRPVQRRSLMMSEALSTAKENLVSSLSFGNGLQPDSMMQTEVTESIEALALVNPTSSPSSSPTLNGKWEVVYAGAPGAGFFDTPTRPLALALYAAPLQPSVVAQGLAKLPFDAATLSSVTVTIQSPDAGQPRVNAEATISVLGGNSVTVALRANLSPRSDIALREDFVEAEVFGQRAMLPGPLATSRNLFISFLDDEYLIVRDDTGLPNVLKRLEQFPEASEPSYSEDDSAPGAG
jgi:hypothetical protein